MADSNHPSPNITIGGLLLFTFPHRPQAGIQAPRVSLVAGLEPRRVARP